MSDYERILSFWFGELDELGQTDSEHSKRWWKKDAGFDQSILEQFLGAHEAAVAGQLESWLVTPRGRLGYIILLDQFSRNMFRNTPRMFESDPQALRATLDGIEMGADRELRVDERVFFYMPLMHSETIAIQERCVDQFRRLKDEVNPKLQAHIAFNLDFAIRHRDIVANYGRFPHRNAIIGRASSSAELEFLRQPGSAF